MPIAILVAALSLVLCYRVYQERVLSRTGSEDAAQVDEATSMSRARVVLVPGIRISQMT
jgi:hypothetical protein